MLRTTWRSGQEAETRGIFRLRRRCPERHPLGIVSACAADVGLGDRLRSGAADAPLERGVRRRSGVDVSPTMVALARENLAATAGARVELSNGSDLRQFASESIDFCYSYAVFQHIPERAIVLSYMREACRVLKPGGGVPVSGQRLAAGRRRAPGTHRRLVGPLRRARGFGRSRRPSRYLERRQLLGRRDSRFRRGRGHATADDGRLRHAVFMGDDAQALRRRARPPRPTCVSPA